MRPISALLSDYSELENQELYFADLSQLNDPMEGFIDFVWKGDKILWTNLLRNYLICLESITALASLVDDAYIFTKNDIPIFKTFEDYPTQMYKDLFDKICSRFFKNNIIIRYITFLSNRDKAINRTELKCHLRSLHLIAFTAIIKEHKNAGLNSYKNIKLPNLSPIIDLLKLWEQHKIEERPELLDILFQAQIGIQNQLNLITLYNQKEEKRGKIKSFVLIEFPDKYVDKLVELAYPNPYIACFTTKCDDSALWGYYADNHKGVCLKFRTNENNKEHYINLGTTIGYGSNGKIKGSASFRFEKVKYVKKYPELNFFKSLGKQSVYILEKYWYSNVSGEYTKLITHLDSENKRNRWHSQYWKNHLKCLTIKLPDWKKECEYRLVLDDFMEMHKEVKDRKLKYSFNDLEGIIFGCRTSTEDKLQIMKIIEKKCKENNRKEFDFYQAEFNPIMGNLKINKLDLLNFT
jgi:hypothetical protein